MYLIFSVSYRTGTLSAKFHSRSNPSPRQRNPAFPKMTEQTASSPLTESQRSLILKLYEIGSIKFGSYTLKSGIKSPIYIDLRLSFSDPDVLIQIADNLLSAVSETQHDLLCGVPYTALPFATAMSVKARTPMVVRRKEVKDYGTKKLIEGNYEPGQSCLVVEDLVTSGMSVLETVQPLKDAGLVVNDVVALLDREQGANDNLKLNHVNLHSVFKLSHMLQFLVDQGKIGADVRDNVLTFIKDNQIVHDAPPPNIPPPEQQQQQQQQQPDNTNGNTDENDTATAPQTYAQRAEKIENSIGKRLLELMEMKKTNLAVAADVTTKAELLDLAEKVGPEICMLKTHADVISDWDQGTGHAIAEIAARHQFLVFEDRKFADIGNTVLHQVSGGVHAISKWADVINAHAVPGPGVVSGLARASDSAEQHGSKSMGLLLLAEMSSEGNLATALPEYKEKTIEMAQRNTSFVFGFISMGKIAGDHFVYLTPGVKIVRGGDGLGQQYATPESVIGEKHSDVIIVGRGIYEADDKLKAAKEYRQAGWRAYEKRCSGLQ